MNRRGFLSFLAATPLAGVLGWKFATRRHTGGSGRAYNFLKSREASKIMDRTSPFDVPFQETWDFQSAGRGVVGGEDILGRPGT